jgi:hypothetical protein
MSTATFSSDGDSAMREHSHETVSSIKSLSLEDLTKVYEIGRSVHWINQNSFKIVGL